MEKKYFWLTDTHFNFHSKRSLVSFFLKLESEHPDGIFLTGDISTGPHLIKHLSWLEKITSCPIYFVIGNHDVYRTSFQSITDSLVSLSKKNSNFHYLTKSDIIYLNSETALIGHDGWYDASWREPYTPLVFIWDFFFIKDFRSLFSNEERLILVRKKAEKAAAKIGKKLEKALETHSTVYLLTHIPPWPPKYTGFKNLIEEFWKPYNSSKSMAICLENIMNKYPDKKLIVLAGHTHTERTDSISPNIELRVGTGSHDHLIIQEKIRID